MRVFMWNISTPYNRIGVSLFFFLYFIFEWIKRKVKEQEVIVQQQKLNKI